MKISAFGVLLLGLFVIALNTAAFVGNGSVAFAEDEKVTDVVCGMRIDKNTDNISKIENKSFYFCSAKCKTAFDEDAGKYTCLCFVGFDEGDDPCECGHCSGEAGKCKCSEDHGGHDHHHGHDHGHDDHGHGH